MNTIYMNSQEQTFRDVVCPSCHTQAQNEDEASFIISIGECGTCDHVRGDVMMDQWDDIPEEDLPDDFDL